MPTRGDVKTYKPKRSEGYALCEALTDGRCTCLRRNKNPCQSLAPILRDVFASQLGDPEQAERARMAYNRRQNAFINFPSNAMRPDIYLAKEDQK